MENPNETTRRIALDAMGGDLGPAEVVAALQLALQEFPDLCPVTITGDQEILGPLLAAANLTNHPKVSVLHASEVISMGDEVMTAIKRKRDSSMIKAIELVKDGKARAVISTGNTKILVCQSRRSAVASRAQCNFRQPLRPHGVGHRAPTSRVAHDRN